MSKTPAGPKEIALREMRERKHEKVKTLIPYAGKPKGNESRGATYGAKHKKKGRAE